MLNFFYDWFGNLIILFLFDFYLLIFKIDSFCIFIVLIMENMF